MPITVTSVSKSAAVDLMKNKSVEANQQTNIKQESWKYMSQGSLDIPVWKLAQKCAQFDTPAVNREDITTML